MRFRRAIPARTLTMLPPGRRVVVNSMVNNAE
ncbi:MAG: hypothetical protein JWN52_3859 [Actinomycetia bacterium]|nr:hypothetical protein [Actinomycetes bacterium]